MLPVEYSEVSISAPNTTMTSWPSRATPRTLDWAGSKFARSCGDMAGAELSVGPAANGDGPGGRVVQAENQPHGGGLADTVAHPVPLDQRKPCHPVDGRRGG